MNCYFCNTELSYQIFDYYGLYICPKCKKIHIEKDKYKFIIPLYIKQYFPTIPVQYADTFKKLIDLPSLSAIDYLNLKTNIICKQTNCRKNCELYTYKYYGFNFNCCSFTDMLILDQKKFNKFIRKMISISRRQYYIKKIKEKIVGIFIEGVPDGKK